MSIFSWLFGREPQPPKISDIRAGEWNQYLDLLNNIIKGQYPEQIRALDETIRRQAQASGQSLLNKAMARMAAQGTLKSGLANQVNRDVAAMTASNTANLLNQLHSQLLSSALSALPNAVQAERSNALKQYALELQKYGMKQQDTNALLQGLSNYLGASISALPALLPLLAGG